MAEKLPTMQNLEVIDFGDCLLKTAGAKYVADALEENHTKLQVGLISLYSLEQDIKISSCLFFWWKVCENIFRKFLSWINFLFSAILIL